MKKYELLLILPGTLDEKEAATRAEEITSVVKEHSEDVSFNFMGKNRLAYPVKQIRYGYFYTIVFSTDIEKLKSLQGKLSLMRDVLRAIINHYNEKAANNQKISYSTDTSGMTTIVTEPGKETASTEEASEEPKKPTEKEAVRAQDKKIDLKDIDKKLDEILGGDIIPGV